MPTDADSPALALARELIRRPSVTPADAGCQTLIAQRLEAAGFAVEHLRFGDVDNIWAVAGDSGPITCLAGHTDVVPVGPADDWSHGPFDADIDAYGWLYGRGAADMKSSLAAMVCAAERFRGAHPDHQGRIAFLITSDEEGPAVDGTRAVIDWLSERGETIDRCLVGEPSSETALGDIVKNGRRGSLNAKIRVVGRQGHVAYPHKGDNALHRLIGLLDELIAHVWDEGDAAFPPTSFQVSNLTAGTGAENVMPGVAEAACNWRFSTLQSAEALREIVETYAESHGIAADAIDWRLSGEPFVTREGALIEATRHAVLDVCGHTPTLSTGGGTSDGRFIAPTGAEVLELGPANATIHQADERIAAADVERLSRVYEDILVRLHT